MFNAEWTSMTYAEQVEYLGQMMHVVASEMEMGYGANSEGEIMGATVSILGSVPGTSISKFYENNPHLLKEQMKKAIDNLKEHSQVSRQYDGELLSVDPQLPQIQNFVKDILETYSRNLKAGYSHLYNAGEPNSTGYWVAGSANVSQTRFQR